MAKPKKPDDGFAALRVSNFLTVADCVERAWHTLDGAPGKHIENMALGERMTVIVRRSTRPLTLAQMRAENHNRLEIWNAQASEVDKFAAGLRHLEHEKNGPQRPDRLPGAPGTAEDRKKELSWLNKELGTHGVSFHGAMKRFKIKLPLVKKGMAVLNDAAQFTAYRALCLADVYWCTEDMKERVHSAFRGDGVAFRKWREQRHVQEAIERETVYLLDVASDLGTYDEKGILVKGRTLATPELKYLQRKVRLSLKPLKDDLARMPEMPTEAERDELEQEEKRLETQLASLKDQIFSLTRDNADRNQERDLLAREAARRMADLKAEKEHEEGKTRRAMFRLLGGKTEKQIMKHASEPFPGDPPNEGKGATLTEIIRRALIHFPAFVEKENESRPDDNCIKHEVSFSTVFGWVREEEKKEALRRGKTTPA